MGSRAERNDEWSSLSKRALRSDKVVTIPPERNRVFERVFCADGPCCETSDYDEPRTDGSVGSTEMRCVCVCVYVHNVRSFRLKI